MRVDEALQVFYRSRTWGCRKSELKAEGYIKRWSKRWEAKEVSELTERDIQELERERQNGSRAASSLNYERNLLRQFCAFCARCSLPLRAGISEGWKARVEDVNQECFTFYNPTERRALRDSIREDLKRYVFFSAVTGLRQSTIRRLIWGWISPGGVLRVPPSAVKNRVAIRQALPAELIEVLGPRGKPQDPVFGEMPPWPQTVWKEFRKACRRAGVPVGSPHDLRRSFASSLMEENVPLLVIATLGGWKKVETIRRYYCTGVPDSECRRVLGKLI